MQAFVEDFQQQVQSIMQSYEAAKAEEDIIQADMRRQFVKCEAEQKLVYQTARAEAQNAASEEYNMLKISRDGQVGRPLIFVSGPPERKAQLQHKVM